jgi:outer membrane protein
MKIQLATPALMALLMVPAAWGQAASAPAGNAGPQRLAVINIQTAITNTSEGKQAAAELQSKYTPRQNEMENMRKQIEDLQTRLRTGQTTLSDEEKQRLAAEGDRLTRAYQRKQQELQDDGNEDQREVVDRIGRKMLQVIEKYSKDNNYALVVDVSGQNTPVVSWSPSVDITQDIVRLYDQAYPVKASSTAPAAKPAAPKPAAAQPKPQQ